VKIESAEFVISAFSAKQFLRGGMPEVAFVGRSNVGKSSLLNRLLARKGLARVGSTPGRTQSVNYFEINRRLCFVDLPGFGFAKAPKSQRQKWAELMNLYFRHSGEQMLLVQLVDSKVGATRLDEEAQEYFRGLGIRTLIVATKIDKVPRTRRARSLKAIRQSLELPEEDNVVPFSAVSGEGVKELWKEIQAFLESYGKRPQETE
jgi:GTP-binding protein